jgi:hemoglobin
MRRIVTHEDDIEARRARITADVVERTGITEEVIERLVRHFYGKVRRDLLIGPVFESRIADWEPHLQKMFAFWSSVVLMTGRYRGQPARVHMPLPIEAAHFDRWLALFAESAREVCTPEAAALFVDRSQRIAASLEMGVAIHNGALLAKGERYENPALRAQAEAATD